VREAGKADERRGIYILPPTASIFVSGPFSFPEQRSAGSQPMPKAYVGIKCQREHLRCTGNRKKLRLPYADM
jgi:hypothetical protein